MKAKKSAFRSGFVAANATSNLLDGGLWPWTT